MNSLKLIEHPFNQTIGLKSIGLSTKNLILGSFPPHEVTEGQNFRLDFYYGSNENRFWDIFFKALNIQSDITIEAIQAFLREQNFGILDIIKSCYRRNGNLSSDIELAIIDQENLIPIFINYPIVNVYCTSQFVCNMLFDQLIPAFSVDEKMSYLKEVKMGLTILKLTIKRGTIGVFFQCTRLHPMDYEG